MRLLSVACLFVFCIGYGSAAAQQKSSNPVAGPECSPGWHPTSSMSVARQNATATLLPDGTVLVVGGMNERLLASAEIYDPATGNWTETASLEVARATHAAQALQDGRVLV